MPKRAEPVRVWVPPGGFLLVSPDVEVRTMGDGREAIAPPTAGPGSREEDPLRAGTRRPGLPGRPGPTRWGMGARLPARPGRGPVTGAGRGNGPEPDIDAERLYVTPELIALAEEVSSRYDMKVSGMTFITAKPDKGGAIWRIETNRGPRSLKQLHRTAARSLFSVAAQDYLVQNGARVPAIVRPKDGSLGVEREGKLWIVTDWVEGLIPASKVDLGGAASLCYGLGEFHKKSRGYVPPAGAQKASRLYRWPKTYQKMQTKIGWFRNLAQAYPEMPAAPAVLAVADQYEKQAADALRRLQESGYHRLTALGEPHWGLAHQDYGWSNGQEGPGGVWIIDLDGVAYDLPVRDLRKLITSTMDDMGIWDVSWMLGMIKAYHEACPIEPELFDVLVIDMSLPNEFYKNVKADVSKTSWPAGAVSMVVGEVNERAGTDLRPGLHGGAGPDRVFSRCPDGAAGGLLPLSGVGGGGALHR